MSSNMRPIHPGEILRGEMGELGPSARRLAVALNVPANRITGILNEQRAVTADTALRLARYLGIAPEFWLNLQSAYDLLCARREVGRQKTSRTSPAWSSPCSPRRDGDHPPTHRKRRTAPKSPAGPGTQPTSRTLCTDPGRPPCPPLGGSASSTRHRQHQRSPLLGQVATLFCPSVPLTSTI
ncbi:MAG: HigA family addiction module antitoxin [Thermodesulfobacteriota bacterium]